MITFYILIFMIMGNNNILTVVKSDLINLDNRVKEIDEAKVLVETIKSNNASLELEEKAAILKEFINSSSNIVTTNKKDSTDDLIIGKWMIWYNVISKSSNQRIGTVRAFDWDAKVVFTPYGSKQSMNLWRLTSDWVIKITKVQ